jgi:hypothetical protein
MQVEVDVFLGFQVAAGDVSTQIKKQRRLRRRTKRLNSKKDAADTAQLIMASICMMDVQQPTAKNSLKVTPKNAPRLGLMQN